MLKKNLYIIAAMFVLSGYTTQQSNQLLGQPVEERNAQDALPKSSDPMWELLAKTKIHVDNKKGLFSATYPDEIKAMVGKQVTVNGFILPLEPTEKFKHFILSKRTPTCPFCPPGQPNEIMEVWLDSPIKWDEDMITVTGTFGLTNNQQLGMFFTLKNAKKQK